jgi:hypothetical protein
MKTLCDVWGKTLAESDAINAELETRRIPLGAARKLVAVHLGQAGQELGAVAFFPCFFWALDGWNASVPAVNFSGRWADFDEAYAAVLARVVTWFAGSATLQERVVKVVIIEQGGDFKIPTDWAEGDL